MNLRNRLPFFLAYAQKPRKPIFLEYVETDGSSYIDTEYCANENTVIEYTWETIETPTSSYNGLFGSRVNTSIEEYHVFLTSGLTLRLDFGRYAEPNVNYKTELNTKYTIKAGSGEIYINDELVKSYTPKTGQTKNSMYLGNFNNNGTPYTTGVAQKIYPCKIFENGVLVRNFKPCITPNGKVAMYDDVNKKYHYGQGTGTLKAGGRFVESIYFDGACVVDTGIKHQTCTIETTIKFEETGTRQLMGFGTGSGQYWGAGATGIFDYMAGTNALDRTDVVIDFNAEQINYTIYADGKSRTSANGNSLSSLTYRIGAGPTGKESNSYWCTCQVWGQKTYVGGELIQDLRPYVDTNGVACFKDVVTDTLFYNKGTGTLTYTEYETVEYVEFDGTKYIDTGYKPNSNSCVSVEYYPYYNSVFACIFGTQNSTDANRFYGLISSTLYRLQVNSCESSTAYFGISENKLVANNNGTFASEQQKVTLTIDNYKKQIKVESDELTNTYNTEDYSTTHHTPTCSYSMLLGDRSTAGAPSSNKFKGQIHSCRIHESGKLVRDMIPVKRSDGVVCMYDKVGNKYYELKTA